MINFDPSKAGGALGFITQMTTKGLYYLGISDNFKQNEKVTRKNKITSHVIMNGATINDHVITGQLQISQEFIVSILSRSRLAGLAVLAPASQLIEHLSEYRGFVRVITAAGVHDNMVIDEMSIEQSDELQNAIKCSMSFIEIRTGEITDAIVEAKSQFDRAVMSKDIHFDAAKSAPKNTGHIMASFF